VSERRPPRALLWLVLALPELRRESALVIAFAGAGLFWLAILLWLASMDFLTRPAVAPP
jgi:hypothetical protein